MFAAFAADAKADLAELKKLLKASKGGLNALGEDDKKQLVAEMEEQNIDLSANLIEEKAKGPKADKHTMEVLELLVGCRDQQQKKEEEEAASAASTQLSSSTIAESGTEVVVLAWLDDIKLGQYKESFEESSIDLSMLLDLKDNELKDLGVS